MTAEEIISHFGLQPHPEGGWFKETWREQSLPRAQGTAIYFLLEADQNSHWHKVDATEIWHWYVGAPVQLDIYVTETQTLLLGADISGGQEPQHIVPKDAWQRAKPVGGWAFVGCTVSPGFEFDGFELAPKGWNP
ncbi:MAG: cupin domain-containing protein [Pseudomonadota bacterium]